MGETADRRKMGCEAGPDLFTQPYSSWTPEGRCSERTRVGVGERTAKLRMHILRLRILALWDRSQVDAL